MALIPNFYYRLFYSFLSTLLAVIGCALLAMSGEQLSLNLTGIVLALTASLLGVFILHENLGGQELLGICLIFTGIVFLAMMPSKQVIDLDTQT